VYHIGCIKRRQTWWDAIEFVTLLGVGLAGHIADQMLRFDTPWLTGAYGAVAFNTSLWISLRGYLLSPGDSIFLFTPLLCLLPWTMRRFWRSHRDLTVCIGVVSTVWLIACGSFTHWAGLWCFGPRYLAALTPFLLLPLGPWLEAAAGGRRWAIGLAVLGLAVNLLSLTINFNAVFRDAGYAYAHPEYAFLFEPSRSPLLAYAQAALQGGEAVDFWLLNLARSGEEGLASVLATGFLGVMLLSVWQLRSGPVESRFSVRPVAWGAALLTLMALVLGGHQPLPWAPVPDDDALPTGLAALASMPPDAERAAYCLAQVVRRTPSNLQANYALAVALETAQRVPEAHAAWQQVRILALAQKHPHLASVADEHLATWRE
jgi:hypothetical protein